MTRDVAPVELPISGRTYLRACCFSGVLTPVGIGVFSVGTAVASTLGAAMALLGIVSFADLIATARLWKLDGNDLRIPRLWAPHRIVAIAPKWRPGADAIGRRDSMFQVETPDGSRLVHPNLLVARSDVRQWLHLIGER